MTVKVREMMDDREHVLLFKQHRPNTHFLLDFSLSVSEVRESPRAKHARP